MKRSESRKLLNDMHTIYVESRLASPLAGLATLEMSPTDTVRKLVSDFLFSLENEDGIQGLAVCDRHNNKLHWDATLASQGIKEGSTLYLVHDTSSFFKPVHVAIVGIVTICIAVVLFLSVLVLFVNTGGDIPFDFGIVIDAGSTHTEVYLYQWAGSKYFGTGEVKQKNFCTIEKGIAEGFDPAEIISCVSNVTESIPHDVTSPVYLHLGATAGMRILNASNPLEARLILNGLKYALKSTSIQEGLIDIIEGYDEGLFSWITTNFLSRALLGESVISTYGALDLGGASTQLAFALNPELDVNSSDIKVMKLYGQKYNVFTKSFLCFGLSQAARRSEAIIFMENKNSTIIDPCLPKNYSITLDTRRFLEAPCIQNKNLTNWLETNGNVKKVNVVGTSDYKECKDIVKKLINPGKCKDMEFMQCLEFVNLAEQNKTFMAFSSFYYIANYLNPNGSLDAFVNASKNFCSLSYEEIRRKTDDKGLLSHLLTYCFGGIYMTELLTSNYGFSTSTWKNIIFQQNINDADIGWALGYMINASNAIPEELPRPPVISLSAFIPLVVISILMLILSLTLILKNFRLCQQRKRDFLFSSLDDDIM